MIKNVRRQDYLNYFSYLCRRMIRILLFTILILVSSPVWGEYEFPAVCSTTANLNIRTYASTDARILETVPAGTRLEVRRLTTNGWAEITYYNDIAYCNAGYLRYCEPVEKPKPNAVKSKSTSDWGIWSLLLKLVGVLILLAIIKHVTLFILGLISMFYYKIYRLLAIPFYCLNWIQWRLSRPWIQDFKKNTRTDKRNEEIRNQLVWWEVACYLLVTPFRFVNAFYYNIVVHCSFEFFNYVVEVLSPSDRDSSQNSFILWLVKLPWRILRFPIFHGALTLIESAFWTITDTLVPAQTVFHGTTCAAAESICQGPGRVSPKDWYSGVWNVGGGNYAGNGIYFASVRGTALHYASGSLIVCRVSFGSILDLGLAPKYVYNQCGHPDATGVTKWGLNNGYVTGLWWRSDSRWWEFCMYDWQNRYNDSWRIRPLYVLNLHDECLQRIPGGMYHWLFNPLAFKDMLRSIEKQINELI